MNVNCIKIHSIIILIITCQGLIKFPPLIQIPSYPFMNFQNSTSYYFSVRITRKMLNVNCIKIHSIILSVTCHGLINFPSLIQIPSHPYVNFKTLWVIIFWVWVTNKMLNVNCIKIYSIILSITCLGLINYPPLIQIPSYPFMDFWNYELLFFELVTRKMLNVNCISIYSIILCHLSWFNQLYLTHTHPLISFVNFQNPMSYYFLSLSH